MELSPKHQSRNMGIGWKSIGKGNSEVWSLSIFFPVDLDDSIEGIIYKVCKRQLTEFRVPCWFWPVLLLFMLLFSVKYERIKFLVIALKSSVEVYAWAPKPYHKFMAFKVTASSVLTSSICHACMTKKEPEDSLKTLNS